MSTFPLPTLAAQIGLTGIAAPAFEDILKSEIATEQSIFGDDIVLTPDQQDYQRLAARCAAINDVNQMAIAAYNSFSPTYAQGAGLDTRIEINGLTRRAATFSTVTVTVSGVVGTPIQNGVAIDRNGNLWDLPELVTIPESGAIDVTATAQQLGAVAAAPGDVNRPWTIITGWQSVTNASAATPGAAVETDANLRKRQEQSTSAPSQTPRDAIIAAVETLAGVTRATIYENSDVVPDVNGVPRNSIAIVAEGGDITAIAQTIQQKKAPGTGTYGTTSVLVTDQKGLPITIKFFELTEEQIYIALTIQPLTGYIASTGDAAVQAIVDFLNGLEIGQDVYLNWILAAAGLSDSPLGKTFAITALTIGTNPGALGTANIVIAFNAAAACDTPNVVLTTL
jgi:uncharacterized phage protein gp47/JayE